MRVSLRGVSLGLCLAYFWFVQSKDTTPELPQLLVIISLSYEWVVRMIPTDRSYSLGSLIQICLELLLPDKGKK